MSHVATVSLDIKDLDGLAAACKRCGLEFVPGQKTYRWYGRSVGDYPLPAGFTAEDLGTCEHAIRIPEAGKAWESHEKHRRPYEVGVVKRRDGRPGWTLIFDFWKGGYGLEELTGKDCQKIKQAYATVVATRQAQKSGFRVQEQKQQDGSIRLLLSK